MNQLNMGEMRQKPLKEYLDIQNVLKFLQPDEFLLQVLDVVFKPQGKRSFSPVFNKAGWDSLGMFLHGWGDT